MFDQRAFHFGSAHAVAGHVDHVVDPACDPVIAVLIAAAAVAGEVLAGVLGEIGLDEAFVIAIDGAHLAWPAIQQHQRAFGCAIELVAIGGIDQRGLDAEHREAGAAGLERVGTGQGGDHVAAGFGLPPGIDNRAAAITHHVVIPFPRLGVDWFAH